MDFVKVKATKISKTHIYTLCDKCSVFHHKNGKPRKKPKLEFHIYGSDGDLDNRIENRGNHCNLKTDYRNIDIVIDDTTERI